MVNARFFHFANGKVMDGIGTMEISELAKILIIIGTVLVSHLMSQVFQQQPQHHHQLTVEFLPIRECVRMRGMHLAVGGRKILSHVSTKEVGVEDVLRYENMLANTSHIVVGMTRKILDGETIMGMMMVSVKPWMNQCLTSAHQIHALVVYKERNVGAWVVSGEMESASKLYDPIFTWHASRDN